VNAVPIAGQPIGLLQRRPIIGTSWKMNLMPEQARGYVRRLRERLDQGFAGPDSANGPADSTDGLVFLLPPFVAIDGVREELAGSAILYGAQNVHHDDVGAHTGEISAPMLAELGCRIVEVGHSERRRDQCETDELIAGKVGAILRHDMWPLVCIGESGPERDAGHAEEVVSGQLHTIFGRLSSADLASVLVAYEPWWAIGVGSVAAPLEHVARLHELIHEWLAGRGSDGRAVPVLYGGSVDLTNAAALLGTPGVDGLFVGRAALDPDVFARIVLTAAAAAEPHTTSADRS
jgi:L-erythrulose 1-phosphate isomerase